MGYYFQESLMTVVTYLSLNSVTWIISAEFHALTQQNFMVWYKSCFFGVDISTNAKYIFDKNVSIQLKLMAWKDVVDSEPAALSSRYFNVTNRFLCSVSNLLIRFDFKFIFEISQLVL